jgi:hypothetical protein
LGRRRYQRKAEKLSASTNVKGTFSHPVRWGSTAPFFRLEKPYLVKENARDTDRLEVSKCTDN